MTKLKFSLLFFLIPAAIFFTSCDGNQEVKTDEVGNIDSQEQVVAQTEFDILVNHLESNGDYLNTTADKGGAPSLITAEIVNDMIDGNVYIIDIRDPKTFSEGHIKGAVNVKEADLLFHINNEIDRTSFDKIILACYTGQTASYNASLLNLGGYDNVVALKWGMASWNSKLDQKWNKNIGNNQEIVETTPNPKAESGSYPEIYTGMEDAESILEARVNEVMGMGMGNAKISLEDLSQSLDDFYIVNYWPEEMYNEAHIKSAIQYTPRQSLHTSSELASLPTDRPIAVYCYTGQHSAAVVAYLRILGYDAYTMLYGANGFMNDKLVESNNHGFSNKISNDFELETSEYIEPEGGAESFGGC